MFCFQCQTTFRAVRKTTAHWVWQHEGTYRHTKQNVKAEDADSRPKCLGLDLEADLDEVHLFSRLKASIRLYLQTGRIGYRDWSPAGKFDLSEDNHMVVRCLACFRADTHKRHPALKSCQECSSFANDRHTMDIMMNWVAKALGFKLAHTRIHGTAVEYEQLVTRVLTSVGNLAATCLPSCIETAQLEVAAGTLCPGMPCMCLSISEPCMGCHHYAAKCTLDIAIKHGELPKAHLTWPAS